MDGILRLGLFWLTFLTVTIIYAVFKYNKAKRYEKADEWF